MESGQAPTISDTDTAARVAAVIADWGPRSLSPPAAGFVRGVVTLAAPGTPARARALLFAAAKLAAFGESVGLELSAAGLLDQSVIERFVLTGADRVSPATRRTLRTNLRALARALERYPGAWAGGAPAGALQAAVPEGEITGYLALAGAQRTLARRMRATALICLGAGAGLIGRRAAPCHRSLSVERSGGLLVLIGGRRARAVPVLERYHEPLTAAAAFAGDGYLLGGRAPERRNLTDALTAVLCADAGLPRLQAGRLRATWLVACAERIGLHAFMHAAGISCSQRLGDLAVQLPAVSEEQLVALLGATP